jgi:hypothetical protein
MSEHQDRRATGPATLAIFCRTCSSPLIQAADWLREDGSHWSVRLWCPECWQERAVILDRGQAGYLSLAVEEGFACLLEDLVEIDGLPMLESGPSVDPLASTERTEPPAL